MTRPALDLARASYPVELSATPRCMSSDVVERYVAGLGAYGLASRRLVDEGRVPPQALSGNTIFLAFSHFDLAGGIYSREQVTLHRPVCVGETLSVAGEIGSSYVRRGRRFRIMTSETRDAAGILVASSRSTGAASFRGRDDGEEGSWLGRDPEQIRAPAPDLSAAAENPSAERLQGLDPGWRAEGEAVAVTLEMMRAEAGPESRNPIHTDPETALRAGLGRPIAGGPHVLAFVQELLMRELGGESLLWGAHFDVRWLRPVRTGDRVRPMAALSSRNEGLVVLELAAEGEEGTAMVGTATVPVATDSSRTAG